MRIRKSASLLLGSPYSVPAAPAPDAVHPFEPLKPSPMSFLASCSAPGSFTGSSLASPATTSGETCVLNRNAWDLPTELPVSDRQVEGDLVDEYLTYVPCRASWLSTASIPAKKEKQAVAAAGTVDGENMSLPRHGVLEKVPKSAVSGEESEPTKKAKLKKEVDQEQGVKQPTYKCKKNDGKWWHCRRLVSRPNFLCDYHLFRKRPYLNPDSAALAAAEAEKKVPQPPAASKPATSSKPRKKKPGHDLGATEGFYYYAGFGPFRSKRQRGSSSGINGPVPQKKHEEEDEPAEDDSPANHQAKSATADGPDNKAAEAHDDASSCEEDITGGDEESSDDDYNMNNNGEHRDGKRKNGWKKRGRKPVKARSLKSLM